MRASISDNLADALSRAVCRVSSDPVKRDLELRCIVCDEHLCDVQHGDTIETLALLTLDHVRATHGDHGETPPPAAADTREHDDECITRCPHGDDHDACRIGHGCWCTSEEHCEQCAEAYGEADLAGGRCLKCGATIVAGGEHEPRTCRHSGCGEICSGELEI
jgi:hypothetical protein